MLAAQYESAATKFVSNLRPDEPRTITLREGILLSDLLSSFRLPQPKIRDAPPLAELRFTPIIPVLDQEAVFACATRRL